MSQGAVLEEEGLRFNKRFFFHRYFFSRWRLYFFSFFFFLIPFAVIIFLSFFSIEFFLQKTADPERDWNLRSLRQDQSLMRKHLEKARCHPFGFNDDFFMEKKDDSIFRIIVLGDSFIFGDGIKYEEVWTRILERMLKEKDSSIEMLHWGKCGWSTLDQMVFLTKEFSSKQTIFNADLILFAYVYNDPDLRKVSFRPIQFSRYERFYFLVNISLI